MSYIYYIIEKLCKDTELYGNAARGVISERPILCIKKPHNKRKIVKSYRNYIQEIL